MNKFCWIIIVGFVMVITSFKYDETKDLKNETKDKKLKIMIISDLNAGYGSVSYSPDVANTIAQITKVKPDLILCGGDMVAGQKASLTVENIEAMWSNFKSTVLDPIKELNIPFGFTLGNHDASPSFGKDRACADAFWKREMKAVGLTFVDSEHYPFYFSYVKNNVFFMSWDATAAKIKPEVTAWMKQQLDGPVARNSRLRIVLGHLPLYAIVESKNKPGEVNADADAMLNFFELNKVDLYISGHQHAYFPAHKGNVQLLNLGCIGDGPRQILGTSTAATKAYTIMEVPVKGAKKFSYRTFVPSRHSEIDLKSLPDSVVGFNGITKRRDVVYGQK